MWSTRRVVGFLICVGCGGSNAPAVCPPAPKAAASVPAEATPPPTLDGTWRGTLGGALRLVLVLKKGADGQYDGTLESVDQDATLPVESAKLHGDTVRFDVQSVGGVYEGKLDAKREHLTGTWTQNGQTQPLALARGGAPEPPPPSTAPKGKPLDVPLEVVAATPPATLRSEGKTHVVYELFVTNLSSRPLTLKKIEVANPDTKASLGTLEGRALAEALQRPGAGAMESAQRVELGPGLRAVVFMWLEPTSLPAALEHRISVTLDHANEELSLTLPRVTVGTEPSVVAGPPLRGGEWLAGNGPSNTSLHRRAVIPIGARPHVAQRFAIDWVKVRDEKTFAGDEKSNASYFAYGAEALAIGDGVVTETKDGIAENIPGETPSTVSLDTIAGNHVVVDLGKHRFALYAHFKPGSLKVKVGDRVKKGQVLGLVGNSGNSSEPHLHLHVSDAASPLGAEGMPWVIEAYESKPAKASAYTKRTRELPPEDALVRFAP